MSKTSQTDKYLWKTTFSHYLGQMNYRNAKKIYILTSNLPPNEKLEKIQIFLLAPFRIVVLCTKTLTEASMMLKLKKKFFFAFL